MVRKTLVAKPLFFNKPREVLLKLVHLQIDAIHHKKWHKTHEAGKKQADLEYRRYPNKMPTQLVEEQNPRQCRNASYHNLQNEHEHIPVHELYHLSYSQYINVQEARIFTLADGQKPCLLYYLIV